MNGVPPVPPVPQGAAPPLAQVGGHCKTLANRVAWDLAARAAGVPGIPDDELATDIYNAVGWIAAGPGLAAQLQSAIHEAVQQAAVPAVQQAVQQLVQGQQELLQGLQQSVQGLQQEVHGLQQSVQGLQQEVQALTDMAVATHNLAARLNNRNRSAKNDQLQLLRKERHPQPLAPGAAAAFGALPPPGMFPPTTAALYGEWTTDAHVTALAAFYEEDFGAPNMLLDERKQLLSAFIRES